MIKVGDKFTQLDDDVYRTVTEIDGDNIYYTHPEYGPQCSTIQALRAYSYRVVKDPPPGEKNIDL